MQNLNFEIFSECVNMADINALQIEIFIFNVRRHGPKFNVLWKYSIKCEIFKSAL